MSINHWIVKNLVCTLLLAVGGLNMYAQKDKYLIEGRLHGECNAPFERWRKS